MEQAAEDFAQTYVSLLAWSWTWWFSGDDPGIAQVSQVVTAVRPVTRWVAAAVLALGVVGVATVLIVHRRGRDLAAAVLGLARALLVVAAGWLVLASAWAFGDRIAGWIAGRTSGVGEYRDHVARAATEADPVVALTLSIVGVACCLAFVGVLLARVVLAVLLAAGMPVLATGSLLRARSLRLVGAWAIAVIAFEPLTALVYRVGHALVMRADHPVIVLLVACLTSFLAAGMLPATARVAGAGR